MFFGKSGSDQYLKSLNNGENYEKMLKSRWSERELRVFGRQPQNSEWPFATHHEHQLS